MKKTIMLGIIIFLISILFSVFGAAKQDSKVYQLGYDQPVFSETCGCPRIPPPDDGDKGNKKPPPPDPEG